MKISVKNVKCALAIMLGIICLSLLSFALVFAGGEKQYVSAVASADEITDSIGLHGDAVGGDHVHNAAQELPDNDAALGTGAYYLGHDTVLTETLTLEAGQTVDLCLNGHSLTMGGETGALFHILDGGALRLWDCAGGGRMTNSKDACVFLEGTANGDAGEFTMNGGMIGESVGHLNSFGGELSGKQVGGAIYA